MGRDAIKASAGGMEAVCAPLGASHVWILHTFVRSRMYTDDRPSAARCGPSGQASTHSSVRVGSEGWPSSQHPPGDQGPVLGLSAIGTHSQKQLSRANLFPNAAAMLIYKLHW